MIARITRDYLAGGAVDEWLDAAGVLESDLTVEQVDAINERIEGWATVDPEGYSEGKADELNRDVVAIMREAQQVQSTS